MCLEAVEERSLCICNWEAFKEKSTRTSPYDLIVKMSFFYNVYNTKLQCLIDCTLAVPVEIK